LSLIALHWIAWEWGCRRDGPARLRLGEKSPFSQSTNACFWAHIWRAERTQAVRKATERTQAVRKARRKEDRKPDSREQKNKQQKQQQQQHEQQQQEQEQHTYAHTHGSSGVLTAQGAFDDADADGNGYLTGDEIDRALHRYGLMMSPDEVLSWRTDPYIARKNALKVVS